jgi:hypothetical protein
MVCQECERLAKDHVPNKNVRRRDALPLFCFSLN